MGEVITGKEMVDVPLVSRSYTDLLFTLQPGCGANAIADDRRLCGPIHIRRICCSAGFGQLEFRGLLRQWHARV